jgi:MFS family permease
MHSPPSHPAPPPPEPLPGRGGSLFGSALEFYDFFAFGAASATVFPALFFPAWTPTTSVVLATAVYALGFASRPLGGFVFDQTARLLGPRWRSMGPWSVVGLGSVLVGLLPGYRDCGLGAPLALALLRCVQGLGLGAGSGARAAATVVRVGPGRRGLLDGDAALGSPIGLLAGNGAFGLTSVLAPAADFDMMWWRVPFLLSGLLVGFGLLARSLPLRSATRRRAVSVVPLGTVCRAHWRQLLVSVAIHPGSDVTFYVVGLYVVGYSTRHLGLPRSVGFGAVVAGALAQLVGIPLFGALSDWAGRRKVMLFGAVASAAWVFVFFRLLDSRDGTLIDLALFVGMLLNAAMSVCGVRAGAVLDRPSVLRCRSRIPDVGGGRRDRGTPGIGGAVVHDRLWNSRSWICGGDARAERARCGAGPALRRS